MNLTVAIKNTTGRLGRFKRFTKWHQDSLLEWALWIWNPLRGNIRRHSPHSYSRIFRESATTSPSYLNRMDSLSSVT